MKLFYIPLVIISIFFLSLKSKEEYRVAYLKVLEIKNKELFPVLDSIIKHEQRCDYYTPKLVFDIHFRKINDSIVELQSGAIGSMITKLDINKNCFEFEGHLFIVNGKKNEYDTIFEKTNRKKQISYYLETEGVIINYDDDTYSFWIHHYINNKFFLKEVYDTYCKSPPN